MNSITIQSKVHFRRGRRSKKELHTGAEKAPATNGAVPRVSRLMALAIRFDQLIRDGIVANQAELARLGHVTRARVTQIMNMINLAPDIQEAIMSLPPVDRGQDPITERDLRAIAVIHDWRKQRRQWNSLVSF